MNLRYVHLSPRLEAALDLLKGSSVVADIGCDHGRLTAALLQQKICTQVIASDISEESLQKARNLIGYIGLSEFVSFRAGNGLTVFHAGECDAIAILGMGGTLMARILDAAKTPLNGANSIVLQPMRAQSDIRSYLHQNGYRITDDRIVREGARLYQILCAVPDQVLQALPDGWPEAFYDVGFVSFQKKESLLPELVDSQLKQHIARMKTAGGTQGEAALRKKIEALLQIRSMLGREDAI